MSAMTSQITGVSIAYSAVCSSSERKHQSSASLAFLRGIHRWPVNFPHKIKRASNVENVSIWWRHHETQKLWRTCNVHCGQQCACWGPSTINSSRQSDAETRPAIIDSDNGLSPVQCQQLFEPMLAHWETNFSEIWIFIQENELQNGGILSLYMLIDIGTLPYVQLQPIAWLWITSTQVMVYHWLIPCETLVHTGSR